MAKYKYYTKAVPLPDGTRKYVRGKTKEELEEKLSSLRGELALGIDVSSRITFKDYAEQWYAAMKEPYVGRASKRAYNAIFKYHLYPRLGGLALRDIRAMHVRALLADISGCSPAYRRRICAVAKAVFNAAVEDNIILRSPFPSGIRQKGGKKYQSHPLTTQQEQALLSATDLAAYPFVFIALHTGMRRGELLGLMWKDVDFDKQVIHVRRHVIPDEHGKSEIVQGAKTDAGVRDIPMPLPLISFLKKLKKESNSVYVLPAPDGSLGTMTLVWDRFRAVEARFPFHVTPHVLRHTYITRLFESGTLDIKQIQKVAGHADPSTTLEIYTHYREERDEETIKKVQAAF